MNIRRSSVWIVSLLAAMLTLGGGLFGLSSSAGANPAPGVLAVNTSGHDSGNCTTAPCRTITYALTQAASGATINVGPGVYAEQLIITKAVSIHGSGPSSTVIDPTTVPVADTDDPFGYGYKQFATVDIKNTTGVNLTGLTVNGLAAQPSYDTDGLGCAQSPDGIYFHDASGTLGAVDVTNLDLPTDLFGCQGGLSIYVVSDPGATSTVGMDAVTVTNYDKNGITCNDVGTTCAILNSVVKGIGPTTTVAQNGIQVVWASADIENSIVLDNSYSGSNGPATATGLLLFDASGPLVVNNNYVANNDVNIFAGEDGGLSSGEPIADPAPGAWQITDNTINNATNYGPYPFGDGYGDGIQIVSTSNAVDVVGNTVNGAAEFGIALYGASHANVWENQVGGAVDGIYVGGPGYVANVSTHDEVNADAVTSASQHGVVADTDSALCYFNLDLVAFNGHSGFVNNGTDNEVLLSGSLFPPLVDVYSGVVVTLGHIETLR